MHPLDSPAYDDQLLTQYLLGALPAGQTERLDELSIADDDFAWRLAQVENNLVDDFVRGNLDRQTLQQFHGFYLQSARRRQKVAVAEGFFRLQDKLAQRAVAGHAGQSWISQFLVPRKVMAFAMASGLLSAIFVCIFLITDDLHLRRQVDDARAQQVLLDQHARQLENEVAGLRSANAANTSNVSDLKQLKLVAALLPVPMRGIGSLKTISVPAGADLVVLQLELEAAGFSSYKATLKEAGTQQNIWQSDELAPSTLGDQKILAARIPANLLKAKNYVAEVAGATRSGKTEITGDYAFRVVLK